MHTFSKSSHPQCQASPLPTHELHTYFYTAPCQDNRSSLESCARCNTLDSNLSLSTWILSWSKLLFKLNRQKLSSTLFFCCSRSLVTVSSSTRSSTSSSRSFHGPLWGFSLIRALEIMPFHARFEWRSHGKKLYTLQLDCIEGAPSSSCYAAHILDSRTATRSPSGWNSKAFQIKIICYSWMNAFCPKSQKLIWFWFWCHLSNVPFWASSWKLSSGWRYKNQKSKRKHWYPSR